MASVSSSDSPRSSTKHTRRHISRYGYAKRQSLGTRTPPHLTPICSHNRFGLIALYLQRANDVSLLAELVPGRPLLLVKTSQANLQGLVVGRSRVKVRQYVVQVTHHASGLLKISTQDRKSTRLNSS